VENKAVESTLNTQPLLFRKLCLVVPALYTVVKWVTNINDGLVSVTIEEDGAGYFQWLLINHKHSGRQAANQFCLRSISTVCAT